MYKKQLAQRISLISRINAIFSQQAGYNLLFKKIMIADLKEDKRNFDKMICNVYDHWRDICLADILKLRLFSQNNFDYYFNIQNLRNTGALYEKWEEYPIKDLLTNESSYGNIEEAFTLARRAKVYYAVIELSDNTKRSDKKLVKLIEHSGEYHTETQSTGSGGATSGESWNCVTVVDKDPWTEEVFEYSYTEDDFKMAYDYLSNNYPQEIHSEILSELSKINEDLFKGISREIANNSNKPILKIKKTKTR